MLLARNIVFLISRLLMLGGIVGSCANIAITMLTSIKAAAADHPAGQDLVLPGLALVQAAQALAIRAKETMEEIINSLAVEVSSKITSPSIRVTPNSLTEGSTMFLQLASTSEIGRCASGRLMQSCRLSRNT